MRHSSSLRILAFSLLLFMAIPAAAWSQEDLSVKEPAGVPAEKPVPIHEPQPSTTTRFQKARINRYLRQLKHPLSPRDQEMRMSVNKLGTSRWRFVHVELRGHKVVTGNIVGITEEGFNLETGILGSGRFVAYRDVTAAPREVSAVGTRTLRTLEWTGFVTLCVAAIPLAVVFYPLVMAGVIQD